ncbi:MAG: hypothetical protein M3Y24_09615 [Acidobacteriota bacterium]|nr:hypothetical protein [Acidobacteriota bacterium]
MKQRGGLFAVFAAFTAASFHVGSISSGAKALSQPRAAAEPSLVEYQPSEDALRHVLKDFTKGEEDVLSPSPLDKSRNSLPERKTSRTGPDFDWIIATVPDPEHSNLRLDFDRELESIQLAAQNSGYQFERYWLPWRSEDGNGNGKEQPHSLQFGEDSEGRFEARIATEGDSRREILPGVLLFHRKDDALLKAPPLAIFLVGETPNSGILPDQFRSALCYGKALSPGKPASDRQLQILGPAYSGSFPSLAKLITSLAESHEFTQAHLRSWTSDRDSQLRFEKAFAGNPGFIDFRTTRASSLSAIAAFAAHVRKQWHDNDPIVLLAEEGTAFGAGVTSSDDDNPKPLKDSNSPNPLKDYQPIYRLDFPRNISTLRNATENDSHLPGFGDDSKPQMPRNGITFSLRGDEHASSDIRAYSKQQTPVSQESVLFSIGSLLKTNTVHYVGIVASDPLDLLFLSRYLHSACPNVRIFTLDSDLLFEHGSDSADYTGILSVTTSPLFPMNQLWTGSRGKTLHTFASSNFEAIYNAQTDLLLNLPGSPTYGRDADFRDYRDPFHNRFCQRYVPPLWLTTVARGGYQPLDVLYPEDSKPMVHEKAGTPALVPEYWPGWGYSFCLLICLGVAYWFALICARPRGKRLLAIFSVKHNEPNPIPRAFYLFAMGCSLGALFAIWLVVPGVILVQQILVEPNGTMRLLGVDAVLSVLLGLALMGVLPYVVFYYRRRALRHSKRSVASPVAGKLRPLAATAGCSLAIFGVYLFSFPDTSLTAHPSTVITHLHFYFLLGCFATAATLFASLRPLREALIVRSNLSGKYRWRYGWNRLQRMPYVWGTFILLLITFVIIGYAFITVFSPPDNPVNFLAACRSLDLTSGVSPLIPVTLLLISLTALAFIQLRRVAYYDDRYPRVPHFAHDVFCPKLHKVVSEIRMRTRILSFHPAQLAAYVGVGFILLALLNQRSHQTYENEVFERLMLGLPLVAGFFLILVWIRFMIIWSTFSEFLQQLERHPLRNVFSLLPRDFIWSPVWQGGGKKRTHVAITRSLECVLALKDHQHTSHIFRNYIRQSLPSFQAQVRGLLEISAYRRRVPRVFSRRLENKLVALAEHAATDLEKRKWALGSYELKAELAKQENTREALHIDRASYLKEEPETICGELVAYRLLAFINYVLWQLDNLVGYLSFGFLMLIIAMNSYNFRSGSIIDWILIAMFAVMTIGIVTVFAQADRDAILSRISGTEEGKLDRHFYTHLISYGFMPVLVLAATHFPVVGRFFFSWVKPALEAIH